MGLNTSLTPSPLLPGLPAIAQSPGIDSVSAGGPNWVLSDRLIWINRATARLIYIGIPKGGIR